MLESYGATAHPKPRTDGAPAVTEGSCVTATDQRRLRALPAIDRLVDAADNLVTRFGRLATTDGLRVVVAAARTDVRAGGAVPTAAELLARATRELARRRPPPLRPVINATGVVIHTNLGRAPLAPAARDAVRDAAGTCDLEYDLTTGERGTRTGRLEPLLCEATGAEAAFAVNNAAAALVLVLAAVAADRSVLVSRGELIEIGGSFRLPDVMAASGARLHEVGTTNRTRADDFRAGDDPAAILTLHPSNYRIVGFVEQPSISALAAVAAERDIPLLYDVGSGLLRATGGVLATEPAVDQALRDGADLVLCSADKLLGGPQAGLLVGRRDIVEACRRHPLARALRLDKLRIAALQSTLELHLAGRTDEIPVPAMLHADPATLTRRCDELVAALHDHGIEATTVDEVGMTGGGAAPDVRLTGPVVRLDGPRAGDMAARLRAADPPIIVRVRDGAVLVDLRTVDPAADDVVASSLITTCDRGVGR